MSKVVNFDKTGYSESGGEEMGRVVIENVPDKIKKQYKATCALKETTMRDDLIHYMNSVCGEENEYALLIADLAEYAWELAKANGHKDESFFREVADSASNLLERLDLIEH